MRLLLSGDGPSSVVLVDMWGLVVDSGLGLGSALQPTEKVIDPIIPAVVSIAGFGTNDGNVVVPDLAGGRVAEDEEDEDVGGLTHSTVRHSLGDKRNELVGGKNPALSLDLYTSKVVARLFSCCVSSTEVKPLT
eukprot:g4426.t1